MSTCSAWLRWWYSRQLRAEFAEPGGDHVEDVALGAMRHFLLQPGDAAAAFEADLAVVGLDFAGQQLEQGRLAGAVAADQGDALARFDRQIDVFEQERAADAEVDIGQGDQGHPHSLAGQPAGGMF